jgi:hypothetical protein
VSQTVEMRVLRERRHGRRSVRDQHGPITWQSPLDEDLAAYQRRWLMPYRTGGGVRQAHRAQEGYTR